MRSPDSTRTPQPTEMPCVADFTMLSSSETEVEVWYSK